MTQNDLVRFWNDGSEEAWKTVQALLQSRRYLHALFFCHLTLEKLLKARYAARHNTAPPPVHNLPWLAQKAGIPLSGDMQAHLAEITTFNISGRYEDYKNQLYKKADERYATQWITHTEELLRTIRQQ